MSLNPLIDAVTLQIEEHLAARALQAKARGEALTVGICGSQGSGKSTLTAILKALLERRGLRIATLSIDDLYLTLAERETLARTVHPLLRTRGVPGTHDVALALEVLARLRQPGEVPLPSFDKSCDDRRPKQDWPRIAAPSDIVILEGWCVGALPQKPDALIPPINPLEAQEDPHGIWRRYVNDALAKPYRELFTQLDLLLLLAAPGFEVVHRWRLQQEEALREKIVAEGGDTSKLMDAQGIRRFISHYERITRHILAEMPDRADILVRLDGQRHKTLVRQPVAIG